MIVVLADRNPHQQGMSLQNADQQAFNDVLLTDDNLASSFGMASYRCADDEWLQVLAGLGHCFALSGWILIVAHEIQQVIFKRSVHWSITEF